MKVAILGCGAYGLALSSILIENHCEITMWTKFEEEKRQLEKTRENKSLLPGYTLPNEVKITTDIEECVKNKELLIIVIPVAFVRELCINLQPLIANQHILIASKGIEQNTKKLIHEIVGETLSAKNIAILSGPTFAIDIPKKYPIALTVATKEEKNYLVVKKALSNSYTTLERTTDVIGVELCGAIKNIFAIQSGILEGLHCNESTKALFLTKAIKETEKILKLLGGDKKTILTYAGIGDMLLTCTSEKSRNYTFGMLIATNQTEKLKQFQESSTIEGAYTLESIHQILLEKKLTSPLIETLYTIVHKKMIR